MDWKIEQLRELETAFRVNVSGSNNPQNKHIYLDGKSCAITHLLLVRPSVAANHEGRSLEIDLADESGAKHEIRLYTAGWPEESRK